MLRIHHGRLAASFGSVLALVGCVGAETPSVVASAPAALSTKPVAVAALDPKFAALYQPMTDKFPVPGVAPALVRKGFERREVADRKSVV